MIRHNLMHPVCADAIFRFIEACPRCGAIDADQCGDIEAYEAQCAALCRIDDADITYGSMMSEYLPDTTHLPSPTFFSDGVVWGWSGQICTTCNGADDIPDCSSCGGTGDWFGPLWQWEE